MGKRLKLLVFRKSQGLTQKEIAEKLGINATYYSRIETGNQNPSYEVMGRFKEVFGIADTFELFEKN